MVCSWKFLFVIACLGAFAPARAKTKLIPRLNKQLKTDVSSYQRCRQDILKKAKPKSKTLKAKLEACRRKFPAAAIYTECKSTAIKDYKKKPKAAKAAIKKCRTIQAKTTYNPDEAVAVAKIGKRVFFTGVDLAKSLPLARSEDVPNYNCELIGDVVDELEEPEFLMFGNQVSNFLPWRGKAAKRILPRIKARAKKNKEFWSVPKLGRLYEVDSQHPLLYFPLSHCYFEGPTKEHTFDHKMYYFIDRKTKSMIPYFGISFLNPSSEEAERDSLSRKLKTLLGKTYRSQNVKNRLMWISPSRIRETDSEGDPKNVCKAPRRVETVGVIKRSRTNPGRADYLAVVNLKNLCKYGDFLAKRWR